MTQKWWVFTKYVLRDDDGEVNLSSLLILDVRRNISIDYGMWVNKSGPDVLVCPNLLSGYPWDNCRWSCLPVFSSHFFIVKFLLLNNKNQGLTFFQKVSVWMHVV